MKRATRCATPSEPFQMPTARSPVCSGKAASCRPKRRSYDTPPPELSADDPRYEGRDRRYAGVTVPRTECLKDTVARVIPYWDSSIAPAIRGGRRVLVAAHGNSLRALVKHLDGIGDQEIVGLNIPTGIPLVYELDDSLRPVKHSYLGDPEEVARRVAAVSAQGKVKV